MNSRIDIICFEENEHLTLNCSTLLARIHMRGCSTHYHETLGLTESIDTKLIDPPKVILRSYCEGIEELVASIREKGLVQPIIVRPSKNQNRYEVVAGARRLEACKRLRWSRVPCIIRVLSDRDAYEISLTENVQRKTMNPIEEAQAFRMYVDNFGWGGESVLASKIGKSQEYISQRLSLLSLPRRVRDKIIRRQISPSIGQEISRLRDTKTQLILSEEAVKHRMTVGMIRETTRSIRDGNNIVAAISKVRLEVNSPHSDVQTSSFGESDDRSEPEFTRGLERKDTNSSIDSAISDLNKAILILKLALTRLGTLIDEISEDSPVKDLLLEKRLIIHNLIDSMIKSKIKIGGRAPTPTSYA